MAIEVSLKTAQSLYNRAAIEGETVDELLKRLLKEVPPVPKFTPENDSMRPLQAHLDAGAEAIREEIAEEEME